MYTIQKLSLLILLTAFMALFSCEKETTLPITNSDAEDLSFRTSDGCNNYDYHGQLHNQGLAYNMSFENELIQIGPNELELQNFIIQKTR